MQNMNTFSEFTNDEGFELENYVEHLFEQVNTDLDEEER